MHSQSKLLPATFCLLFLTSSMNLYAQNATQKIDSLERILVTHPPTGTELLRIYSNLSSYYTSNYLPEKNREYALKGIDLALRLNNPYEVALLYNNLGSAYDDLSQYDSTMVYYQTALNLIEEMENKKQESVQNIGFLKGITYANIGNLYNTQGVFDKAVEYYLKAIVLFEEFNIPDRLAKVFRNISLVYININNYKQAEYYLNKGAEINSLLQDSLGLASTLTRLGHIYLNQLKYPEALQRAEEADKIYAQYVEKRDLRIYNLRVLSAIWNNGFNNEQKAMEYALKALEESKKMEIRLEISRSLQMVAALHLENKRYKQAEQTALEALQTDSSNLTNNILLYECLTIANAGLGNVVRAQDYFALYKAATIAYSNESFQSSLSEMEVKYETEKKEMRILAFTEEKRLIMRLGIAIAAVLLLALAASIFLWRWTVQKRRLAEKQREMAEQEKMFAEQQIIQLQQEKQLVATQAVLDGEVQERARLARDLHDGLGSILAATKYNLADFKKGFLRQVADLEYFEKAMSLLDESMHEMRRVAHHLMPETLSRYGLKQSVADFCNSVPHVKFAYYGDESRIESKIEVMVYRIMHELVSNALKHSKASHILVQITRYEDIISLTVQDDGCGFDPSSESKGMGLNNIHTRVAAYNGSLMVDSKSGVGTEVNVELRIGN